MYSQILEPKLSVEMLSINCPTTLYEVSHSNSICQDAENRNCTELIDSKCRKSQLRYFDSLVILLAAVKGKASFKWPKTFQLGQTSETGNGVIPISMFSLLPPPGMLICVWRQYG